MVKQKVKLLVRAMREREPAQLGAGLSRIPGHWAQVLQIWLLLQSASSSNLREGQIQGVNNKLIQTLIISSRGRHKYF